MTTRLRRMAGSARFIISATAVLTIATIAIGRSCGLTRADWPGWLQAVGSVWAVLVAVWVSWQQGEAQRRNQEAAEEAEVKGILRSLRLEVETTLNYAGKEIGRALAETPITLPVTHIFGIPELPFPIFDALIPKLGRIPDQELQRQIVDTYSTAKGLALTIHHHNGLAGEYGRAQANHNAVLSSASGERLNAAAEQLFRYSGAMREAFDEGRKKLEILFATLTEAISDTQ